MHTLMDHYLFVLLFQFGLSFLFSLYITTTINPLFIKPRESALLSIFVSSVLQLSLILGSIYIVEMLLALFGLVSLIFLKKIKPDALMETLSVLALVLISTVMVHLELWILIIVFFTGLWVWFKVTRSFFPSETQSKTRYLQMELYSYSSLSLIEDMLRAFNIKVLEKKITRDEEISFQLSYKANALVNHLFLKRLFQLESIGQVVTL